MEGKKVLAIAILAVAAAWLMVYGALQTSVRIPSKAQIKAVGLMVYTDRSRSTPLTAIDWGFLEPGETKTFNMYAVNTGNLPASLGLKCEDWNPAEAIRYISLAWNYAGEILGPGEGLGLALTLHVAANVTGITAFTFTIVVSACG